MNHTFVFQNLIVKTGGYALQYACSNPNCMLMYEISNDSIDDFKKTYKRSLKLVFTHIALDYPTCPYNPKGDPELTKPAYTDDK